MTSQDVHVELSHSERSNIDAESEASMQLTVDPSLAALAQDDRVAALAQDDRVAALAQDEFR